MRRIKVFQAQIGFFDSVVAAPSQAAALRAWGVHQNLFSSGDARITTDKSAVAAALQYPEQPLRRAVGSTEPFSLEPANLPVVPDVPKKQKQDSKPKAKPRPTANRTELNVAEAALRDLDNNRKLEEAGLRREEEALQGKRAETQSSYARARREANAAVQRARETYRKAGGID